MSLASDAAFIDKLFAGMAQWEDMTVLEKRQHLKELPPLEGNWPFPASLTRFGRTKMDPKMLARFVKKYEPIHLGHKIKGEPSACWSWQKSTHETGYGRFWLGFDPVEPGRKIWAYSHRIAFEHWIGIPPPGYVVDHLCEHKTCCRPAHLWPLSGPDNTRATSIRTPYKRRNQYSVD